ncbi:MAG: thioredoxin family protein [Gemmatimonadales bacterium]|nr:MAG: thioredoxin family protein [Gemmatimonadales bacterium]
MMNEIRYRAAPTFDEMLEAVQRNRDLWHGVWQRARLPGWVESAVSGIDRPVHLLALSEDWCGDAVNSLPWVARLAEASPGIDLRVLSRDENADLMDAHLTNGSSRSIPVVIAYDDAFGEIGWWGPRPAPLQAWVREDGLKLPGDERYLEVRKWYARDRGETILCEVLELISTERPAACAGVL